MAKSMPLCRDKRRCHTILCESLGYLDKFVPGLRLFELVFVKNRFVVENPDNLVCKRNAPNLVVCADKAERNRIEVGKIDEAIECSEIAIIEQCLSPRTGESSCIHNIRPDSTLQGDQ